MSSENGVDALTTDQSNALVLITGASGFIGSRVVERLLERGFTNLRCLTRPSGNAGGLEAIALRHRRSATVDIVRGNLLSRIDCEMITRDVSVIYHLAAARGEKSVPDAYMNSVVTTRNLIEAALAHGGLRRFVNVSSFAVYTNVRRSWRNVLDESSPTEKQPSLRGDAYCFAKVKQDELVIEYGRTHDLPYVLVRPGYVYGPGNEAIPGRVGIGTFGLFLHLGGNNTLPLTYVDNCADAIVLAGYAENVHGQVLNVVDDDLPSSRSFLRAYKRHVRWFPSVYLPHAVSRALCSLWSAYSQWSQGQLPPTYNSRSWTAFWRRTNYSNAALKARTGWRPQVSTEVGLARYFESCRRRGNSA